MLFCAQFRIRWQSQPAKMSSLTHTTARTPPCCGDTVFYLSSEVLGTIDQCVLHAELGPAGLWFIETNTHQLTVHHRGDFMPQQGDLVRRADWQCETIVSFYRPDEVARVSSVAIESPKQRHRLQSESLAAVEAADARYRQQHLSFIVMLTYAIAVCALTLALTDVSPAVVCFTALASFGILKLRVQFQQASWKRITFDHWIGVKRK
jgi:hypothetical protein